MDVVGEGGRGRDYGDYGIGSHGNKSADGGVVEGAVGQVDSGSVGVAHGDTKWEKRR